MTRPPLHSSHDLELAEAPDEPSERTSIRQLPLDSLPDAALVAALVHGNQRAASVIWHRHVNAVRSMLHRSLGPDQEIDDLTQDVFVGFVRSAAKLVDPSTLRSYLVAIAFRVAAMEIRRRKVRRWVTLTRHGDMPDALAAGAEPDERHALSALYRILDSLSTRERLVFVARHVEGLQIEEAARALELSKATVWRLGKSSLERVIEKAQKSAVLSNYVARTLKGKRR